jgi:hypothetical protein
MNKYWFHDWILKISVQGSVYTNLIVNTEEWLDG